jgi:iron complex transport system substrate-binding protein
VTVRIVSLLPSATEILFALGLGDHVVGVTFECDHPAEARTRRIVSTSALPDGLAPGEIDAVVKQRMAAGEDLYRLDRGAFADIDPTLIITQDLCAVCAVDLSEVDDALAYLACTAEVLTLDPRSLDEVLTSIGAVGAATGTEGRAVELVAGLRQRLATVAEAVAGAPTRPVLLLEWCDPAFTAGHWVPDLVSAAGGTPVLGSPGANSVGVDWATVRECGAEVVVVAPCGFRLDGAADQATDLMRRELVPAGAEVWAIDADAIVVRPGPRVVDGVETLARLVHPERCGPPDPGSARRVG